MDRKKSIKARIIDWGMVAAIIAGLTLIVYIAEIKISQINDRYNASALEGVEIETEFSKKSGQQYAVTIEPCKGNVMWGWNQEKGKKGTKYQMYYKKTTASKYTKKKKKYTIPKNDTYYGGYTLISSVNGNTDYNVKVQKVSNKSTKTKLTLDLYVD